MAQILLRGKGPLSVGYVPRGPAFGGDSFDAKAYQEAFDDACRNKRAVFTLIELDRAIPESARVFFADMDAGMPHVQPSRTVKIPLLEDEPLLKQMHQKSRYSVRLAMRRGVVVKRFAFDDPDGLQFFHELLLDTSSRNEFGVHDRQYYEDFLDVMKDDAGLFVAFVNDKPAAALISVCFGTDSIYMYGGSSTENRAHGSAFLLQFEAMRWARSRGMKTYDLWGIPLQDPETSGQDGNVAGTSGDDWRGLFRFKTRFGGEIVNYPPTYERIYSAIGTWAAKRYLGGRL